MIGTRTAYVPGMEAPGRFDLDQRDLRRGASAKQRLLAAIHRHFRKMGGAPSWQELHDQTGVRIRDMARELRGLDAEGLIVHHAGRARGIEIVRRAAMLSDAELELEVRARGATLTWPRTPMSVALTEAYPVVDQEVDCGGAFADLLGQIQASTEDGRHGAGEAAGKGGDAAAG